MPIHASAIVHPDAVIDPSAQIGPRVVIDGPVKVGANCIISASAVILGLTEIGADCRIHSHATVGDVPQDRAYDGSPSYCVIGEGCILREGVTVHRATGEGEATVLGNGCFLMTNSHVAHNCVLGDHVTLVSGALLGGYVQVGEGAIISGNAAIHQFVRIGQLAMVSLLANVVQDVPPFLMTDREGRIVGLNTVGLVRAGIPSEARQEIKDLFRLVYRSGMPLEHAIECADEIAFTPPGREFISFLTDTSRRGLCKTKARKSKAA